MIETHSHSLAPVVEQVLLIAGMIVLGVALLAILLYGLLSGAA